LLAYIASVGPEFVAVMLVRCSRQQNKKGAASAFDSRSNPRDLWQTVRNAAIDQHGLGITAEQIDTDSEALFIAAVTHHFYELTTEQITALFRMFEAIVGSDA
jgi:hypothetical protein